ncbi:MAG: hypothetical protein M3R69_06885 [Acidobacteriota bacterium]|nr:hypothetical protein [Acidobacteriota bacterium]
MPFQQKGYCRNRDSRVPHTNELMRRDREFVDIFVSPLSINLLRAAQRRTLTRRMKNPVASAILRRSFGEIE